MHRFPPQGLRTILQFAGQIEIFHQCPDFFTLLTDSFRLAAGLLGQSIIFLELFRPPQNQRKRCADVMADPSDPVGSCRVPPLDNLIARTDLGTGAVEFFCQFPGKALC